MSRDAVRCPLPAIGVVELGSIARGVFVLDQMAKRAQTSILMSRTYSPGRYLILVNGLEAEVDEALGAARRAAGDALVDLVYLPDPAEALRALLAEARDDQPWGEALAIVELTTIASGLLAADRVIKECGVHVHELRLGAGLDGKSVFTLSGPLDLVEATREVLDRTLEAGRVAGYELIAQPHGDLPGDLLRAEGTWVRGR